VADVAGCDLYIGIVGLRYGFIPRARNAPSPSWSTSKRATQRPTLVFVKDEDEIKPRFHDAVTNETRASGLRNSGRKLTSGTARPHERDVQEPEDLKAHVLRPTCAIHSARRGQGPNHRRPPYPASGPSCDEADRFFGRDAEVESLLERVLARGDRFLALIGASGSGKSSLVHAGLIPS